jgi:hypothetical protein
MIEAGLGALGKFSNPHRTDNIADALEDWAKKIGELAARILEHHKLMPGEINGSSGTRS